MGMATATVMAVMANILSLTHEVREAALDLKALRRKVKESGDRAWEWAPAEANARKKMLELARGVRN